MVAGTVQYAEWCSFRHRVERNYELMVPLDDLLNICHGVLPRHTLLGQSASAYAPLDGGNEGIE